MTERASRSNAEQAFQQRHAKLWAQGAGLVRQQRWDEAADCFLQLLVLAPGDVAAMVQAAHLLLRQDHYRQALALAKQAADARPVESPDAAVQIAILLRRFEQSEDIQRLFAATAWDRCRSAPLLTEAARLLMNSAQPAGALTMVDHALAVDPQYPHGHYLRGCILAAAGNAPGAAIALQRSLTLAPDAAHTHWMLSWQRSGPSPTAEDLQRLMQLMRAAPPDSQARAYLAYALHNHLHRARQYDASWETLESALQAKRLAVPYSAVAMDQLFGRLLALQWPALPSAAPHPADPLPIFIVGMHRSGTTLLERLLAGHGSVTDGGETQVVRAKLSEATDHYCSEVIDATVLDRLDRVDWVVLGDALRASNRWRAHGRAALTEKLPSNYLAVGLIARALPEARFLHMQRDPVDTCFSNLRTFFGHAAPYSNDQQQMADYYVQYRGLMAHWQACLPGRILDIDYAALVDDPDTQMRRVMAFCGLQFEPQSLDVGRSGGSVATASLADVRDGISKDRGGAWRPYQARLMPLLKTLQTTNAVTLPAP